MPLSISIAGTAIPTDNISLPLVLRSPLFATSDGKTPGSYIFNTSFPATNELRRVFGQAHRYQRHGRATAKLPYEIRSGMLRYLGNCVVTEANADTYEIGFMVENGDLAANLKEKSLKDLDLGGDRTLAATLTIAHTPYLSRSIFEEEQFIDLIELPLEIEDTDFTNSLTLGVFTCPHTEEMQVKFDCYCNITWGVMRLQLCKNGGTYDFQYVTEDTTNHIVFTLNVNQGDELVLKLSTESELTQHDNYMVDYYMTGIMVEFSSTESGLESDDFAVFPIQNPKFLDNFPDDAFQLDNLSIKTIYSQFFKVLNYYKDGAFPTFLVGTTEGETFTAANLITPFLYINYLLSKIAETEGYLLINNPFATGGEFEGAVLFNAYAENNYTSSDTHLLPVKYTFNLVDHVPDIKQSDFLNWLGQLTGYLPSIDNNARTITFQDVRAAYLAADDNPPVDFPGIMLSVEKVKIDPEYKGIKIELKKAGSDSYLSEGAKELSDKMTYKGSVEQVSQLPASGNAVNDYYLVTFTNEFYVWQYNSETYTLTWTLYGKNFPLIYKEGEEPYLTITTEFSPVFTSRVQDDSCGAPANRWWMLPITWQPGILEGFPESLSAEYGLQMLFYKGLFNDSQGNPYPLGTSWMKDYTGNTLDGIDLNAEAIFNNRYKEFAQWLAYSAKPVTFSVQLTTAQLRKINFAKKYRINGAIILIKEIRLNILPDGMSLAEMDAYTV